MVKYNQIEHTVLTAGGATKIVLQEHCYVSEKLGKKVYIQAGLHGGETSQWCLHQLHHFLLDNLECGEVHIVPYANPLAWMQRGYFSTMGKFSFVDGKDFNRCFLDKEKGDCNERICQAIMKIAMQADLVVDLHTSKSSNPFVIYTKKVYEPLVKVCGMTYNQYSDDEAFPALQGTFNAALDRKGIENISIECGGHNEYSEKNSTQVYDALLQLLAYQDLITLRKTVPSVMYCFEKRLKVFAATAGLFKQHKKLGDEVKKGDVIGGIYDAAELGLEVEVVSPVDGILHITLPGHIVWEGDVVAEIVPQEDLKPLIS